MEVLMAMSILSISLLGLAMAIPAAVQANQRHRVDSEATMLAQRELEQMGAQPLPATSFTDSQGNAVQIVAGGSALNNGKVDFSQAAVSGYNCVVSGTSNARYELRWNVQSLADGAKLFTVAARKAGPQRSLLPPVNLSLRVGR